MATYAFILGRLPALSVAEILRLIEGLGVTVSIAGMSDDALVVGIPDAVDVSAFFDDLGGSTKMIRVTDIVSASDEMAVLDRAWSVERLLGEVVPQTEVKIPLGVSVYGDASDTFSRAVRSRMMAIKRELKSAGYDARVVGTPPKPLSSASVTNHRLIELGAELVTITVGSTVFFGRTVRVQAFEEFSERDYGRPRRDAHAGMLPPKLARMMLNLSGANRTQATLLDPFCGSGTVVTEALALGFRRIVAADASSQAVEDSKANVTWLEQDQRIGAGVAIEFLNANIRHLPNRRRETVDVIVTEPSLGPALRQRPTRVEAEAIVRDLTVLYRDAFQSFTDLLRSGGTVVMTFPVIRAKGGEVALDVSRVVPVSAFSAIPFPRAGANGADVEPHAVRYYRPGQFVERDIRIFIRRGEATKH